MFNPNFSFLSRIFGVVTKISLCFMALLALAAEAQVFNVPTTNSTGTFTISWSGGITYVLLEQQIGGSWVQVDLPNQPSVNPSGSAVLTRPSGTYSFRIKSCGIGGQGSTTCQYWPMIRTITVTVAPTGTLTSTSPCYLPGPESATRCTVNLNITKQNTPITCVWNTNPTQLNGCQGHESWGGPWGWATTTPRTLELRAYTNWPANTESDRQAGTLLAQTTAVAKLPTGTLNTTSPCSLPGPESATRCTVTLTSTRQNVPISCLWLVNPARAIHCGTAASWVHQWIYTTTTPQLIELRGHVSYPESTEVGRTNGILLAQKTVAATPALAAPSVPSSINVLPNSSNNTFKVSWGASSGTVTYYELSSSVNDDSWTVSGLFKEVPGTPGDAYTFSVKACNASGCSVLRTAPPSTIPVALPIPPVPPFINVTPNSSNNTFKVSWEASLGTVTHYVLSSSVNDDSWIVPALFKEVPGTPGIAYTFSIKACNASGCSAVRSAPSSTMPITNTDPLTQTAINPTNDSFGGDAEYFGTLSGLSNVGLDGSFNYSIPIEIPPGINSIQPNLVLNYNSNEKNGLLGQSWSLSGLSVISRCRADLVRDDHVSGINSGNNYKYCLDGMRLIEISSGEYRLESENFVRIYKFSSHWEVKSANGVEARYGYNSDSRQEDASASTYSWHLDRKIDVVGNQMTVAYDKTTDGIHRPSVINYGQTPEINNRYSIVFHYQNRDDIQIKYIVGKLSKIDKRLSRIEIKANGITSKYYNLVYQNYGQAYYSKTFLDPVKTSRMANLEVCYVGSGDLQCSEKISFDWTHQSPTRYVYGAMDTATLSHINALKANAPSGKKFQFFLDVNGDGKLEAYYSASETQSVPVQLISGYTNPPANPLHHTSPTYQRVDVNGDGRDDVVKTWNLIEGIKVFLSELNPVTGEYEISSVANSGYSKNASLLSFEATQLRREYTGFGQSGAQYQEYRFKRKFEYNTKLIDINGDGLVDLIRYPLTCTNLMTSCFWPENSESIASNISIALNTGSGFSSFIVWLDLQNHRSSIPQWQIQFVDLTGDGLVDFTASEFWPNIDYQVSGSYFAVNNGFGANGGAFVIQASGSFDSLAYVGDFNGDGHADIAQMPIKSTSEHAPAINEVIEVALSRGVGGSFTTKITALSGVPFLRHCGNNRDAYDSCNRTVVDYNNDGLDDIVEIGYRYILSCDPANSSACSVKMYTLTEFQARVYLSLGGNNAGGVTFSSPIQFASLQTLQANSANILSGLELNELLKFMDYNNDGLLENSYRMKSNILPHRIEAVIEANRRLDVEYASLSSDQIYKSLPEVTGQDDSYSNNSNDTSFVVQPKLSPRRVGVKSLKVSNGIGGINTTSYQYAGAKAHRSGYGDLGFANIEKIERVAGEAVGIKTITHYHQQAINQYKLAGRVKQQQVYAANSNGDNTQLLSDTRYQWKVRIYNDDIDPGRPSPHYFPYVYQSSNQSWDLDGTKIADSLTRNYRDYSPSCSPLPANPSILTASAGSGSDSDYHVDGVLLYSETVTCDTSGSEAAVQVRASENLDITSKANTWGLVGKNKQYAWVGQYVSSVNPGNYDVRTEGYTYNSLGQLWTKTVEPDVSSPSALRHTSTYLYNNFGSVSRVTESWTNPANSGLSITSRVTNINESYSANGVHKVTITHPLSLTETAEYHPVFGLPTKQTDANNLITITSYDALGRPTLITYPDNTNTQINYRKCSNCFTGNSRTAWYRQSKTTGSAAVRTYYDGFNRAVGTRTLGLNGSYVYTHQSWNARGSVAQSVAPYYSGDTQKATAYRYDGLGRQDRVTYPDSSTDTFSYYGLVHRSINRLSQTQTRYLNAAGWVMRSQDNLNTPVEFTYWPFGDLKTTRVNNNANTLVSVSYDKLGRKTQLTDPNAGITQYTYNALGLLATQTDAKGQRTCYSYDALGRQTRRVDNASTSCTGTATHNWTYDNKTYGKGLVGSLSGKATDGSNYTEQYTYTPHSLPKTTETTFDGAIYNLTQHYDNYNRPLGVTYPTGYVVANVYNAYGYIDELIDGKNATPLWKANAADAAGNLTHFTLGNGAVTRQGFHPQTGRIETITTSKGVLAIQNHRYTFDSLGNLGQRQDLKNNVTQSFCYDSLNRIKAARFNGCNSAANDYSYDLLGNITNKQGLTGAYTYGSVNTGSGSQLAGPHAVIQANGYSYQYDRNGNLTTATKAGASTKTVVYSPFNTPTSITQGNKWSTIVYGPNQERIKHSDSNGRVTRYVGGAYEEVIRGGVTQKIHYIGDKVLFVQKTGSAPDESYQYLHRDHIGSIVAITGSTLNSHNDVQYLANGVWGERRFQQWDGPLDDNFIPTGIARGFTDHEHLDSVGLIHMNGRVYDQELGRFLSADPLIQAPYNTQSYNRYSYVFNNPLSLVDPSGFEVEDIYVPGVGPDPSVLTGQAAIDYANQQIAQDFINQMIGNSMSVITFQTADGIVKISLTDVDVAARAVNSSDGKRAADSESIPASREWFMLGVSINTLGFSMSLAQHNKFYEGKWRGNNGKWYQSTWGGNGWTGSRSMVMSQWKLFDGLGKTFYGASLIMSGVEFRSAWKNDDNFGMQKAGMDIFWSSAATFGGRVGLAGAVAYSGTSWMLTHPTVYDNTVTRIVDKACLIGGCF